MRLISPLLNIRLSRWAKLLAGLAFVGIGVAFTKQANLGLGPWDVLGDGLAQLIGIQLGTASVIIGVLVLLLWIPIREKTGNRHSDKHFADRWVHEHSSRRRSKREWRFPAKRVANGRIATNRTRKRFISRKSTRRWPAGRTDAGLEQKNRLECSADSYCSRDCCPRRRLVTRRGSRRWDSSYCADHRTGYPVHLAHDRRRTKSNKQIRDRHSRLLCRLGVNIRSS